MTQEQLDHIFTAFTQADSTTTRRFGGTGLGLTISKQLVEFMQGQFQVSSTPGVGTSFRFTARFGTQPAKSALKGLEDLQGKRVLVVDDNPMMRTLMKRHAETFGCEVTAMGSAEEALNAAQSGNFDVALMDWHLSGMDGLAAVRLMREKQVNLPIIMITGDEPELARAQPEASEIQQILSKPVSGSMLYSAMRQSIQGVRPAAPRRTGKLSAPDLSGHRILLVDDNAFNREVGTELLKLAGIETATAENGELAVSAAGSGQFDLILMDIQMPVLDGYAAAQQIRQFAPDLPILALTAHAMAEERDRVLAAGMNDILTKPIQSEALYERLEHWLPPRSAKATKRPAAPAKAPPPATPEPADTTKHAVTTETVSAPEHATVPEQPVAVASAQSSPAQPPGFDLALALARVNNDRGMLDYFLSLFAEHNANSLEQISASLAEGAFDAARKQAHALKGVAGTIGAIRLQAAAGDLEACLTESGASAPDPAKLSPLQVALQEAWDLTQEGISSLLNQPHTPP